MNDGTRFDQLSRIWAAPISRRRALRLTGGAVLGAAVAAAAGPFAKRAAATVQTCTSNADCSFPTPVCVSGVCSGCTTDAQCGPGNVCGPMGEVCSCLATTADCNTACCSGVCCAATFTCGNPSTGTCACPSGAPKCGNACCQAGETCADPSASCCCPAGATPCGPSCCASGVACLDRSNGTCGCPKGTTSCGSVASRTCCPAGTACHPGCPTPSGNTVPGVCHASKSDRDLKDHVAPVTWDRR